MSKRLFRGIRTYQVSETVEVFADNAEQAMFKFVDGSEGVYIIGESNESDYECHYSSIKVVLRLKQTNQD